MWDFFFCPALSPLCTIFLRSRSIRLSKNSVLSPLTLDIFKTCLPSFPGQSWHQVYDTLHLAQVICSSEIHSLYPNSKDHKHPWERLPSVVQGFRSRLTMAYPRGRQCGLPELETFGKQSLVQGNRRAISHSHKVSLNPTKASSAPESIKSSILSQSPL